jgi:flagellar protein FliO/FliZ
MLLVALSAPAFAEVPKGSASPQAVPAPELASPSTVASDHASSTASGAATDDPRAALSKDFSLYSDDSAAKPDSLGWTLFRLVVVLGLVLGLIYLTLNFGLRRLMGLQKSVFGREGLVSVVERIAIEPRVSLLVVKAGSEYLLLGRTEQGLSMLHKLSSEEVEKLQKQPPTAAQMSPFLQKLLSRRGGPPPTA